MVERGRLIMNKGEFEKGLCSEQELWEEIKKHDYTYYVAYQTDSFLSGSAQVESLSRIDWSKLLEIRLFSEKGEFLARRTMIGAGHKFQWRIATEEKLTEDDFIVRYQTIDIDSNFTSQGSYGNLSLLTTGGGCYELPIKENMKLIKVISYIAYGDDGMAYIYDDRMAGFAEEVK